MQDYNWHISWYNGIKPTPGGTGPISTFLHIIKTGNHPLTEGSTKVRQHPIVKQVQQLRAEQDKAKRDALKKKLEAVTWSGTFSKRSKEHLAEYSKVICHDVDSLNPDQLQHLKAELSKDKYVLACFISPSGNGLKVLFHSWYAEDSHEQVWQSIGIYLDEQYGIIVDEKCRDISRLCFLSYDPGIYINESCELWAVHEMDKYKADTPQQPSSKLFIPGGFEAKHPLQTKTPVAPEPQQKQAVPRDNDYLAKCHDIVQKHCQPVEGERNKYVNLYAIQANRYGISEADCITELCHTINQPQKEVKATVSSVYAKFSTEHGDYLKSSYSQPNNKRNTATQAPTAENGFKYNTDVTFWYQVEKLNKKTGEVEGKEFKFSYDDAITFLENNGFYKYKLDKRYQFIHVDKVNNIVDIVTELDIKEFMIEFLKNDTKKTEWEFKQVREMFRRGAKQYCSTSLLEGLDYYNPVFKKDTAETAYVYFRNCYLEISAEGIEKNEYSSLDGFIWKKQIIDFDFTEADYSTGDAFKFLLYAITARELKPGEEYTDLEKQRFQSVCTTIGYLLHRYKSPANTKAVVAVDAKLRRTGEANGRSGKSLFSKMLGKLLNMVIIDGPNFKFEYEFAFQQANIDTELINFNDVPRNFDFYRLFGMVTEEFTFNKKKMDSITIPFADAPKFYISTNYTLKGDGESMKGRQQIIEFSTFFNSEHTPIKKFGRMFFYDWDNTEWCRFYSFFISCIKKYLDTGLLDFPLENYGINKLIDTAGEDFIDFMDENVKSKYPAVREYNLNELFENYKSSTHKQHLKANTFTAWVKLWAKTEDLLINGHKNGERDRRNGITYVTFTDSNTSATGAKQEKLPF